MRSLPGIAAFELIIRENQNPVLRILKFNLLSYPIHLTTCKCEKETVSDIINCWETGSHHQHLFPLILLFVCHFRFCFLCLEMF